MNGRVYFIRSGDDGEIKIGFSASDPLLRLAALQTGNPRRLTLIGSIEGAPTLERELHERFAKLRTNGEWFRADEPLLSFVDGIRAASPPPNDSVPPPSTIDEFDAWTIVGVIDAREIHGLGGSLRMCLDQKIEPCPYKLKRLLRRASLRRDERRAGSTGDLSDHYDRGFDAIVPPAMLDEIIAMAESALKDLPADASVTTDVSEVRH